MSSPMEGTTPAAAAAPDGGAPPPRRYAKRTKPRRLIDEMPEVEPQQEVEAEEKQEDLAKLAQEKEAKLLVERLAALRQLAYELDHDRWRLPVGPTTLL